MTQPHDAHVAAYVEWLEANDKADEAQQIAQAKVKIGAAAGKVFGYADFIRDFEVGDPREWFGLNVRHDGVYVLVPADDDPMVSAKERAERTWHHEGDLTKPALRFPYTLNELHAFVTAYKCESVIPSNELFGLLKAVGEIDSVRDDAGGRIPEDSTNDITALGQAVVSANGDDSAASVRASADFRALQNLSASEVSIEFAAGDSGGVVLNISARDVTRRMALVELDLYDHRKADMNIRGVVMLQWAIGERVGADRRGMTKQIERLRKELKSTLGIIDNPIRHEDGKGYLPIFTIEDRRNAADERAKREAKRLTVSIEELQERGVQFDGRKKIEHSYETDEEMDGDAADKWLKARE